MIASQLSWNAEVYKNHYIGKDIRLEDFAIIFEIPGIENGREEFDLRFSRVFQQPSAITALGSCGAFLAVEQGLR